MARRPAIRRIVVFSDSGGVPRALAGVPKVEGCAWEAGASHGRPMVDILHRPYQPGVGVDYRRYHQVAGCVALTVLDFIAYDNPAYHESIRAWRQYQEALDEQVCLADGVFAISRYVGSRLQRQFAHQIAGPVHSVLLGADHLAAAAGPGGSALDAAPDGFAPGTPFLLVLGNDFEHKNRDFAVKVFADLKDRGYCGRLVLAGFHLDSGSSFGHELVHAGRHVADVIRLGSVSPADKTWLLLHADAVLYPTSSEGFGLIPFEAAALGTPTAFVRFGPLRETLPGVEACDGWRVRAFADHVQRLIAEPARIVAQVREAANALTWASHVDQVLDGYRHLLHESQWQTRRRGLPGLRERGRRRMQELAYRLSRKVSRLTGRLG